jgi:hypothetical protein
MHMRLSIHVSPDIKRMSLINVTDEITIIFTTWDMAKGMAKRDTHSARS